MRFSSRDKETTKFSINEIKAKQNARKKKAFLTVPSTPRREAGVPLKSNPVLLWSYLLPLQRSCTGPPPPAVDRALVSSSTAPRAHCIVPTIATAPPPPLPPRLSPSAVLPPAAIRLSNLDVIKIRPERLIRPPPSVIQATPIFFLSAKRGKQREKINHQKCVNMSHRV